MGDGAEGGGQRAEDGGQMTEDRRRKTEDELYLLTVKFNSYNMIQSFNDLEVYQIARKLEKEIFELTKKFPAEEKYSLTDQIRRSSRSVKANIAEGWGKKIYIDVFKRHLVDSLGSKDETISWLQSAFDCQYISEGEYNLLCKEYDILGSKIFKLRENWK